MSSLLHRAELRADEAAASERDGGDSSSLENEKVEFGGRAVRRPGLSDEDAEWLAGVPSAEERRIFHKVDVCLVPMLAILYLIAHLDAASLLT